MFFFGTNTADPSVKRAPQVFFVSAGDPQPDRSHLSRSSFFRKQTHDTIAGFFSFLACDSKKVGFGEEGVAQSLVPESARRILAEKE